MIQVEVYDLEQGFLEKAFNSLRFVVSKAKNKLSQHLR